MAVQDVPGRGVVVPRRRPGDSPGLPGYGEGQLELNGLRPVADQLADAAAIPRACSVERASERLQPAAREEMVNASTKSMV